MSSGTRPSEGDQIALSLRGTEQARLSSQERGMACAEASEKERSPDLDANNQWEVLSIAALVG